MDVLFEKRGSVGIITLNRPQALNALTLAMAAAMDERLGEWERDPVVRAVVVRGAGERAFSAGGDIRALYDAIKAGASGYLLKEIPIEEVADAIRSVWAGQSRISPSMASKLLTEFASMIKKTDDRQQVPTPRLTEREMEVLKLVAKGLNNRDIAKQLFISENTVKNHIRNILEKLQLHSRMEAVVYAVREKLLEIT